MFALCSKYLSSNWLMRSNLLEGAKVILHLTGSLPKGRPVSKPTKQLHSIIKDVKLDGINIKILPALVDNYMFLVTCPHTKEAALVDPVDPETALKAVESEGVNLTKILTTHHHADHAGGNNILVKMCKNKLAVYGGDERVEGLNTLIGHNDRFKIGHLVVTCIATPCHTRGSICYYVRSPIDEMCVFTGDTLFQGGCGRFFEGNAAEMYESLCKKLGSLPEGTLVFCGHEYTLQNMYYARKVEPENTYIRDRITWAKSCRLTLQPTIPSNIEDERLWNPFMRVHEPTILAYTGKKDPIEAMRVLRKEKDNFIA